MLFRSIPLITVRLRCFHALAFVNDVAGNIGVHGSFQSMVFFSYMPRSGIAGSYGSFTLSFFFFFFGC